ncbi:hypothetical protein AV530_014211 [Patagioenas fasciata monilis]|uniref:Uncharacterized protein n=1 Tax=Patagioenas fasciata monilis TaxID=372326 RepID=A0A1V4J923_PATFA|nr:hypothetical protein AV530_014211 [Patagioenas fasciata monilis]
MNRHPRGINPLFRLSLRPVPLSPYRGTTSGGTPPCPTDATSQGRSRSPTPASFLPSACGTTTGNPQSPGRTALKIDRIPFAKWEKRQSPPTLHRPSLPDQGTQSQGRGRHIAAPGTRAPVSGARS